MRAAHILQLTVVALLGIGLIMVHSAGMRIGEPELASPQALLTARNTIYASLAILAMFIASRLDLRGMFIRTRGLRNPLSYALLICLGLVAVALVPGMGTEVNNARRWLTIPIIGVTFQPSELVKYLMIIVIAWWCARRRGVMHRFFHGLLPPLLLVGGACALIVLEDLGTAALIALVAVCLLLAGGARWWQIALMTPPAVASLVMAVMSKSYRVQRLTAFLDPWADPAGTGYHPIQSQLAFAMGGLPGRGLGNGVQKFGYLPEDTTDFIFSIIGEELGIAGAALVIGLYLVLIWVSLGVFLDSRDTFGRLLGLGVILTIGLQAAINIAVVTVVVPTKGIALPLISSGGTGWIVTATAVGLVAALDNANAFEREAEQPPEIVNLELNAAA